MYGSTRAAEMAMLEWDECQKAAFVRQQFDAQHRYYHDQFADGSFQIIEVDGRPAGRLYVAQASGDSLIVDIALLPEFRNRGVGTGLINRVMAAAAARGAGVTIHVERNNPALRLYARLGFTLTEDLGVYLLLRWAPGAQVSTPS